MDRLQARNMWDTFCNRLLDIGWDILHLARLALVFLAFSPVLALILLASAVDWWWETDVH